MAGVTNKTITKRIKVTFAKRKELERKCQRNSMNWSDAGYWQGVGKKPNCYMKVQLHNTLSHTYYFPTDASALKWNLGWEKNIRYAGHIVTTVLTAAVTYGTKNPIIGMTVGTLAAIAKDELQASVPYPRMARGWSYEIIFEHNFKWSPDPMGQRELKQTVTVIIKDFNGKTVSNHSGSSKFKLDELPNGMGRALASKPSTRTYSDYK